MSPEPVEILYVDSKRISGYVAQITASPLVIEKAKAIGAELSIAGPKVTAEQTEHVRQRRLIEEIRLLEPYLEKNGLLQRYRPGTDRVRTSWVRENCMARRIIVPPLKNTPTGTTGFTFWWSPAPPDPSKTDEGFRQGPLCLLEHPTADPDKDETLSFSVASTYTLLQSLVHYTRSVLPGTQMEFYVPDSPHSNPYAKFSDTGDHPSSLREYHNVEPHCYEFATNPGPMLESWGCMVSTPRRIQTLYRIREIGRDSTAGWQAISVGS